MLRVDRKRKGNVSDMSAPLRYKLSSTTAMDSAEIAGVVHNTVCASMKRASTIALYPSLFRKRHQVPYICDAWKCQGERRGVSYRGRSAWRERGKQTVKPSPLTVTTVPPATGPLSGASSSRRATVYSYHSALLRDSTGRCVSAAICANRYVHFYYYHLLQSTKLFVTRSEASPGLPRGEMQISSFPLEVSTAAADTLPNKHLM